MEKITLYVGLNDKDTKQQNFSTLEAYKITENIAKSHDAQCSIFNAECVFKHDDGTATIEPMLKVNLFNISEAALLEIVRLLNNVFNQEEILVHKEVITRKVVKRGE